MQRDASRSAFWPRSSSPTSSTRLRAWPRWATAPGGSCSSGTTRSCAPSSHGGAAPRWTQRATASSPRSTARRAPSAVRRRSSAACATSASASARAFTPASASSSTARSPASRCIREHGSRRTPVPARCSSRARSRTSSPDPASSSKTAASTSSRASPASGGSTPPSDDAARDAVRTERRSQHRVPGDRRGTARPGVRAGLGLEHRDDVGVTGDGALPRAPRIVLASGPLRQAWHEALRPRLQHRASDSRAAYGRRPRRARGGRLGAGCALRALRGREHVRPLRGDLPRADDGADTLGSFAKRRDPDDDYPWAPTAEDRDETTAEVEQNWGHMRPQDVEYYAPSRVGDEPFVRNLEQYFRRAASPGAAAALLRMNSYIDIRDVLPTT